MRYSKSILKSIFLSGIIFWLVIFSESFNADMLFWAFLSIIPISLCCSFTIFTTIAPWFILNSGMKPREVYVKYFAYYAILCFALCFYGVWKNDFNIYAISFFASAFITTMQTWNWLVTDNPKNTIS